MIFGGDATEPLLIDRLLSTHLLDALSDPRERHVAVADVVDAPAAGPGSQHCSNRLGLGV